MDKMDEILKNTPEYEDYDENEAVLSIEELKELGLLKCSGKCCNGKKNCGKDKCCKSDSKLVLKK